MRKLAITWIVVCSLVPAARAEDAADLASEGERLAKAGRLSEAIERFKQADRVQPRARHACLIALAYIRRELWPQAEIFLTICHERAGAGDPLPDWVPLAEQQLADKLARATVAPVTIRVVPEDQAARARITVSSFAPDERFAPRTIHLPPGTHLVTGTLGDRTERATIRIDGTAPREVVLDFGARPAPPSPLPPAAAPTTRREAPSRIVPWSFIIAGLAVGGYGGAYHALVFAQARDDLAAVVDDEAIYREREGKFDEARRNTILLYGAGAALVLTGVVLRLTAYRDREVPVRVSASLAPGGALVGLEWRR